MPDVKISALTSASTPLSGTEVLPIVQSSATVKVSIADVTAGRAVSATSIATGLGAVGTPAYTFTGDTNTGMWSPAADTIAFSEGGTEAMRIDSSGNVGIGTSSPDANAKLDVAGTVRTSTSGSDPGTGAAFYFVGSGSFQTVIGGAAFAVNTGANNARTERMRIDASGNVGIGSTPAVRFQITQDQAAYSYFDYYNNTNAGGIIWRQIVRNLANTGNTSVDFAKLISSGFALNNNDTGAANFTSFGVGGTERMRITSAGNVGIGTSSPATKLHVSAASGYNEIRVTSGANNFGLAVDGSVAYLATFQSTPLTFQTNSAERMRIASGGDVGIGTNAPSYKLQVNASSGANQVAYFVNDSAGSTLAGISASINGGGNNTNSYHFVGVTQTVSLWYLYGNGTTSYTSDIRVKKNVTTTRDGYLDDVCKLRVVKYNWYNDSDDTPRELGLIAQEVEQVFPGLVQDAMHPTKDNEIHKVLKGSVLTPILLKALQEANAKIDALATRVAQLESPAEQ